MPNYANGKIYTIRFHNSNEIYIGSTTQSLAVRFGGHKRDSSAVYKLIKSKYNGNWEECYYELFENYSCNSKEELHKKEGEIIRKFKNDENYNCINCYIAGRDFKEYHKEYVEINAEKEKERYKKYRLKNIDKLKEYRKQYYEKNPEYNKQYREQNTDKIQEKKKQYYQDNKEKISIKNKEKITCDCGSCINKGDLSQHYKTKKHQDYLASLSCIIDASNESNT